MQACIFTRIKRRDTIKMLKKYTCLYALIGWLGCAYAAPKIPLPWYATELYKQTNARYLAFKERDHQFNFNDLAITNTQLQTDPQKSLSLDEAIMLALRYNPNIQNGRIQRIADKFNLRVIENDFNWQYALHGTAEAGNTHEKNNNHLTYSSTLTPSTSLQGKYGTRYELQIQNTTNTNNHWQSGLDAKIEQPLLRGFGETITMTPLYNAQDQEIISQLDLTATTIQTIVTVINHYRQLILDQNNLKTSALSLKSYAETIKLDKAMIKAGRKAPTEVLQAQAQYASEQVTYQNIQNIVTNDKLTLMNTLGLPPTINITVPNNVNDIQLISPKITTSYKLALQHNTGYLIDALMLQQDQRNLAVAKDNARVKLDITMAGTTDESYSGGRHAYKNDNNALKVNLDLEIPIDNYSLRQAIIQAQVAVDKDKININRDKRELETIIINDIANINSQAKQVTLAKHALILQKKNQRSLTEKLKFGLVSTFEVTAKQQDLNTARQMLIQAKINYLNNLTQLYADMGTTLDIWSMQLRE